MEFYIIFIFTKPQIHTQCYKSILFIIIIILYYCAVIGEGIFPQLSACAIENETVFTFGIKWIEFYRENWDGVGEVEDKSVVLISG